MIDKNFIREWEELITDLKEMGKEFDKGDINVIKEISFYFYLIGKKHVRREYLRYLELIKRSK